MAGKTGDSLRLRNGFCQRYTCQHRLSRSPHQDFLSNSSNGQTRQDLAVQPQLRKQVQGDTTASPKPFFGALWSVVGRGNAGWTKSKTGHPWPCQNCSQEPSAGEGEKKTKKGRASLLNRPSCPPDDPVVQGTGLNRTACRFRSFKSKTVVAKCTSAAANTAVIVCSERKL